MNISFLHSHRNALEILRDSYPDTLRELYETVEKVDASLFKTKISKEKTRLGQAMYCPKAINAKFEALLTSNDWAKMRVPFEYSHPMESFEEDFSGYDEADFVKNKIGIELQLGKYAFTAWDMLYRFLRFHHLGKIKVGIEILPSKILRSQMSSGVGDIGKAFRCLSVDPQVPLLIIGIAP